uniref:Uncharacterized protein n=1 Tax=mine drainage metagenome TaxID=410659 RepID=E6Q6L1_9ZZZZ
MTWVRTIEIDWVEGRTANCGVRFDDATGGAGRYGSVTVNWTVPVESVVGGPPPELLPPLEPPELPPPQATTKLTRASDPNKK